MKRGQGGDEVSGRQAQDPSRIDAGDWQAFLSTFSNENRGRPVNVEVVGEGVGEQPLAAGALLDAIAYDPHGKGDDVVISFDAGGHDPIHAVTELWLARSAVGEIVALEFVDETGRRTILQI